MLDHSPACVLDLGLVRDDFMPSFCIFMTADDDPPHSHIQKQPHLTSWHAHTQIARGQNLNTESETRIHEEETAERTTHFFLPSQLFLGTNRLNLH